jgi:hypothetical protein
VRHDRVDQPVARRFLGPHAAAEQQEAVEAAVEDAVEEAKD